MTLDDIKKLWNALTCEDSGIRILEADFRILDIPGVSEFDRERRAQWLKKLFPGCDLEENKLTGDWILRRPPKLGHYRPLQQLPELQGFVLRCVRAARLSWHWLRPMHN